MDGIGQRDMTDEMMAWAGRISNVFVAEYTANTLTYPFQLLQSDPLRLWYCISVAQGSGILIAHGTPGQAKQGFPVGQPTPYEQTYRLHPGTVGLPVSVISASGLQSIYVAFTRLLPAGRNAAPPASGINRLNELGVAQRVNASAKSPTSAAGRIRAIVAKLTGLR